MNIRKSVELTRKATEVPRMLKQRGTYYILDTNRESLDIGYPTYRNGTTGKLFRWQ